MTLFTLAIAIRFEFLRTCCDRCHFDQPIYFISRDISLTKQMVIYPADDICSLHLIRILLIRAHVEMVEKLTLIDAIN